jgi:Zn-dependent protease with chaperone function
MKIALKIVLAIIIAFLIFGYYTNSQNSGEGEKFIGIGVLIFAFILMPLFVYHRYKNKTLSQYSFFPKKEDSEKEEE